MLGIPLILSTMSISHAPAASEDAQGVSEPVNNRVGPAFSDNAPNASNTQDTVQLDAEILFKTTRTMGTGEPSTTPASEPRQRSAPLPDRLASESTSSTPVGLPRAHSDFFRATLPPTINGASTPLETSSAFESLSDTAKYTQIQKKGPLRLSFTLHSSAVYDDNLTLSTANKRRGLQLGLGPALGVELGADGARTRIFSTYAGTASSFTTSPQERSYDQTFGLGANWAGSRLQMAFRSGFQSSHNSSLDAAERVGRKAFYAGSTGSYRVGGKTTADLGLDLTQSRSGSLLNSSEYRIQEFLNYEFSPKLKWGVGSAHGVVRSEASDRQTYFQALVRTVASVTGKLGFQGFTGNEWRRYDSGQPTSTLPVFGAAVVWEATGKTTVTLDTRRRSFASAALESQNYESTSTSLSAREMISPQLGASLTLGLENAHYSSARPGTLSDRSDSYRFSRLGFDRIINRTCSLDVFCETGENHSKGTQGRPFKRNRVGVSLNISF
jgi:hypothetical protein